MGTSLVVQWLRHHAANAGGLGSIPGQGTRSRTLQRRSHMLQDPAQPNQSINQWINLFFLKKEQLCSKKFWYHK